MLKSIDKWQIGATKRLFARVHSGDGAGAATGYTDSSGRSEGKYITAAQVSTITLKVYDRSSATPNTSLGSPTITSAAIVTAVTSGFTTDGAGRNSDDAGYNFLFDLTSALIATAGHKYRVTCDITMTTGTVVETFGWEGVAVDLSP